MNPFNSKLVFGFACRQLTLAAKEATLRRQCLAIHFLSPSKAYACDFLLWVTPSLLHLFFLLSLSEFLGVAPTYLSPSRQESRLPASLCRLTESHPGRYKRPESSNRKCYHRGDTVQLELCSVTFEQTGTSVRKTTILILAALRFNQRKLVEAAVCLDTWQQLSVYLSLTLKYTLINLSEMLCCQCSAGFYQTQQNASV